MVDDHDIADLDPYELMDTEAGRIARHLPTLGDEDWHRPSRCAGWSVRDVLAHLAATEDYHRACLDGTVQTFMAGVGEKGAIDLASANEIGIREFDGQTPQQILATWQAKNAENRAGFRARDGGEVDSSVGAYPARWQAFHLAFELATHADDIGVPVSAAEAAGRTAWQARFGRFALQESKPDLSVHAHDGATHVKGHGVDVEVPDDQFVQAVAARLTPESGIDDATAAVLSVTP